MVKSVGGNYYNYSPSLFTNKTYDKTPTPLDFFTPANFNQGFKLQPSLTDTGNTIRDFDRLSREATALTNSKPGNVLSKRSVDTGNSTALTVTAADGAVIGTAHSIEVNQVAKAQESTGDWLDTNSGSTLSGDVGIQVKNAKGTVVKTVNTTIDPSGTNKQALEKLASSLTSDVLKAKVETKTIDGVQKSRLIITSNKTGTGKQQNFPSAKSSHQIRGKCKN